LNVTKVFHQNIEAYTQGFRRIVNHGGTSSSKNFSILQLLLLIAQKKQGVLISVMSETMPHLKMGAIRDFENILRTDNLYNESNIDFSNHRYLFGKSTVEFFSADSVGKTTGPRRNILYVNECINIPYPIIQEAELRTDGCIFYDYNPTHNFWVTDRIMRLPDSERVIIKSNYLDNSQLSPAIKHEIELKASMDENFKRVHIDLEFGIAEGLIFPSFTLVDSMPETDKRCLGLDFGYTNHPSAIIDVRLQGGALWFDELLFRSAMTNNELSQFLKQYGRVKVYADDAEPKSIEEIRLTGINIQAANKGKINPGIDIMKSYPINITKSSVNLIKEFRNYKWRIDKGGNPMNEPIDLFNHGIDACRYGTINLTGQPLRAAKFTFRS